MAKLIAYLFRADPQPSPACRECGIVPHKGWCPVGIHQADERLALQRVDADFARQQWERAHPSNRLQRAS